MCDKDLGPSKNNSMFIFLRSVFALYRQGWSVSKPHSVRVYVVDDEEPIVVTLVAILKHNGYAATGFTRPSDVLKVVDIAPPDLLISDVIMHGMSGFELSTQLRRKYPNCKVLLFSGLVSNAAFLDSVRELGQDFRVLTKPVHPTELLAAIRTMVM
jgi:DNA-binding response OmpR family regulator